MVRALAAAALLLVSPRAPAGQAVSILHIKVSLVYAEHKTVPVARHALLISDNPASATPRRVVTTAAGTADVRLRPGNYTVESDEPLVMHGQAIRWTQTLDIVAGRDAVLELTADNAEIEAASSAAIAATASGDAEPSLLAQWQDSVVALWTPTTHASGFVIDPKGLIATSRRSIGTVTSVEVQVAPALKVAGRVVVSDIARDVAIIRVDPSAVAAAAALPLGCGRGQQSPVAGDKLLAIGVPLREPREISRGRVTGVEPQGIVSDLLLADGSAGGPVFAADGGLVGITSLAETQPDRRRGDARVVPIEDACGAVASAEQKIKDAPPPAATHLPIEPVREYSVDELKTEIQRRAGSLSPFRMSSSDFDIAFITPIMLYGAQSQAGRSGGRRADLQTIGPPAVRPLEDFSNWSNYVADVPPVLLIRVTPKQVESFWTTVARGAAQTQGVALPPIRHFKPGFARLRALCGSAEVTPIHPFTLEQRISETDAINEGLYVYDPRALGSSCGTVTLSLYSEKAPEKGEMRVVDAALLQQLWRDPSAYPPQK